MIEKKETGRRRQNESYDVAKYFVPWATRYSYRSAAAKATPPEDNRRSSG